MKNLEQLLPTNRPGYQSELFGRELARRSFADFVTYIDPAYDMRWFHRVIAEKLEQCRTREITKLMLFLPPQHGKSSLASKVFPAYLLGRNANEKIAIASYSAYLAQGFSRTMQRTIEDERYANIFPNVRLPDRGEKTKNAELFEVMGGNGFVKAVGVGGSLTGTPVDIGIIDDPIKDRQEAQSLTVRENVWNWYTDVFCTRLHNDSVQVLIQTRWHMDDLAGRILDQDGVKSADNPTGWTVIKFPALRTADEAEYDPREVGEALWPERHSRERIEAIKANNKLTFESLYQQDPKPNSEALIYSDWIEIAEFPQVDVEFCGLDFGFSSDPTALTRIGKSGRNIYLDELIYETGMLNSEIAQRAKAAGVARLETYADSADPKSIAELRRLGLNVIPAVKGPDSVIAGITHLKEYIVHYTANSRNLKREVNNYTWIMQGDKSTNIPIDAQNHALDGIRYGIFTKYYRGTRPGVRRAGQR